jgi:hypothetical protein
MISCQRHDTTPLFRLRHAAVTPLHAIISIFDAGLLLITPLHTPLILPLR